MTFFKNHVRFSSGVRYQKYRLSLGCFRNVGKGLMVIPASLRGWSGGQAAIITAGSGVAKRCAIFSAMRNVAVERSDSSPKTAPISCNDFSDSAVVLEIARTM